MKLIDRLKKIEPQLTQDAETFEKCISDLYDNAQSDKEKGIITEFVEGVLLSNFQTIKDDVELLSIKAKLLEVDEIIPYSYIAQHYFNKSKAWLSQRIRGNHINKKRARFTSEEIKTLESAIHDVSKKLGSITLI